METRPQCPHPRPHPLSTLTASQACRDRTECTFVPRHGPPSSSGLQINLQAVVQWWGRGVMGSSRVTLWTLLTPQELSD